MCKSIARCLGFVLLLAAVLAGLRHPLSAQTPPLTETPLLPGLQRIAESGKLVVALLNRDVPPLFFTGDDGELTGFDIELARTIGERLGIQVEFDRSAATYDELARTVAIGQADIAVSFLSRTPARARSVLFTRPYLTQHLTLLINRLAGLRFKQACPSLTELLTAAEFSGLLGVVTASSPLARLRQSNADAQPREFQSSDDLIAAVRAGEVAISLQGELVARRYLHENPAAHLHLRLCETPGQPDRIAIAVSPGQYDLLNWLNVFLEDRGISFDAAELIVRDNDWSF